RSQITEMSALATPSSMMSAFRVGRYSAASTPTIWNTTTRAIQSRYGFRALSASRSRVTELLRHRHGTRPDGAGLRAERSLGPGPDARQQTPVGPRVRGCGGRGGVSGVPGVGGARGVRGAPGARGARGVRGAPGARGARGVPGAREARGVPGRAARAGRPG